MRRWRVALLTLAIVVVAAHGADAATSAPALTKLMTGSDAELGPAFEPSIHRYALYPGPGTKQFSVAAFATAGETITVNGTAAASGASVALPALGMGAKVPITVTDGTGASTQYELVYVPMDFPRFETTVLTDAVATGHLYVGIGQFAAVLDNYGVPYWLRKEARSVNDFKKHANGMHSYAVLTPGVNIWNRARVEQVVLDENLEDVARYQTVGLRHTDPHDFLLLPNGNRVLMAYEGKRRKLSRGAPRPDGFVEDSVVQEVAPDGRVVFEWSSWPAIPYREVPPTLLKRGKREYAHLNSIALDNDGNLLLSLRGTSQVIKVSRKTGRVIWKLGGASGQFKITNDPLKGFCGQHTAQRLRNGNLLMFDNGIANPAACRTGGSRRTYSRVAEYKLNVKKRVAELVWSYSDGSFSGFAGSAQRLDNGNTLVGRGGNGAKLATEVDSSGTKVFELRGKVGVDEPSNARSYRVRRFPVGDYPATSATRNIIAPAISGTNGAGERLTCDPGQWNVVPAVGAPRFKWHLDGRELAAGDGFTIDDPARLRGLTCEVAVEGPGGAASASAGFDQLAPRVKLRSRRFRVDSRGRIELPLRCPSHERYGCRSSVRLTVLGRPTITLFGQVVIATSGATRILRAQLTRAQRALIARHRKPLLRVSVRSVDSHGQPGPGHRDGSPRHRLALAAVEKLRAFSSGSRRFRCHDAPRRCGA